MTVQSYAATVNATAQKIFTADEGTQKVKVYLCNTSSTDHVFIGGSSAVTTLTGYEITSSNGQTVANRQDFEVFANEELWAIAPAGKTIDLRVLTVGNN